MTEAVRVHAGGPVEPNSSRWHEVTPSSFAHERAALDYVRELLPDRHPFQAWSNFTFVSPGFRS